MIKDKINVADVLYEICGDQNVYNPNFDLIESGLLDSFAFIELLSKLEDMGVTIQPTRIDKKMLRTSGNIQKIVDEFCK